MGVELLTTGGKLIQFGFAGLCIILLAILVWLLDKLIKILQERAVADSRHAVALEALTKEVGEIKGLQIEAKDHLLSRPCIAARK